MAFSYSPFRQRRHNSAFCAPVSRGPRRRTMSPPVLALLTEGGLEASAERMGASLGRMNRQQRVRVATRSPTVTFNALFVHLVNKQPRPATFTLIGENAPHLEWIVPAARVELDALADLRLPIVVSVPRAEWRPGRAAVVRVQEVGGEVVELRAPLLGPGGR